MEIAPFLLAQCTNECGPLAVGGVGPDDVELGGEDVVGVWVVFDGITDVEDGWFGGHFGGCESGVCEELVDECGEGNLRNVEH